MNNKIKVIDFNECQTWRMKEKGLGGIRGFVKTKENEVYVVKPESLNQTLNEIMAQIILNSLGLSSIEYAFVLINGKHYGALRYIEGLTRIYKKDYKFLNKEQKIEYLKHLFTLLFCLIILKLHPISTPIRIIAEFYRERRAYRGNMFRRD